LPPWNGEVACQGIIFNSANTNRAKLDFYQSHVSSAETGVRSSLSNNDEVLLDNTEIETSSSEFGFSVNGKLVMRNSSIVARQATTAVLEYTQNGDYEGDEVVYSKLLGGGGNALEFNAIGILLVAWSRSNLPIGSRGVVSEWNLDNI
jgi:hypothetical protein